MLRIHFGAWDFSNVTTALVPIGIVQALIVGLQETRQYWIVGHYRAIYTSSPLGHWLPQFDENIGDGGGNGHL